ncbi:MAG: DNA repair protein RecN [Gemmatimonas sp.]|nr:DNA repair protein RecN [Gemmatimonas sp.]
MLSELRIRNFALIDNLSVPLGPGLNVLTGETGAGKSIVVGALSLLLGERATTDVVRAGSDRASIEGVFEVDGRADLVEWMELRGIEAADGTLILKREVALEGRNRAWINGSPTTASLLGELGGLLVSLHGQHEHQTLLRREEQRAILDAFGGHEELRRQVTAKHGQVTSLRTEIARLEQRRRDAMQRADLLRFQVDEIEAAAVDPEEEGRLEADVQRLSHAEELMSLAASLSEVLATGEGSASNQLTSVRRPLEQLVRIDASQAELQELYDSAYYALEELGSRLDDYLQVVEHDPVRLEELRRRQDLLYRLRTKYGPELTDVVRTLEEAGGELSLLDGAAWEVGELTRRRDESQRQLEELAVELTRQRRNAAGSLEGEVGAVLPELGMDGGRFEVVLLPSREMSAAGAEEIEFRVSLNRGFEPKPLATVASGGELSRVMLALKTILARLDAVPTVIFDEVDAGVGGRVALQVGDKMRQVAESRQVLAITHLPQIASRAHRHLLVTKDDAGGRTTTSVVPLNEIARVDEVARMLGGDPESEASQRHARELLDKGRAGEPLKPPAQPAL